MDRSDTPGAVYKAIIDQLVSETRLAGAGEYISRLGVFSNAPDHQEFNAFLDSLSGDQRNLVARMLREERDWTIGDVLAVLSWWITCRGVGLVVNENPCRLS
jgi:hypothetical protein